eukprot:CAMPEP_0114617700 /NCGR_PEP_ID=MMETSP0168-20121206/7330_1 /TAXON_ID=95228 ORGANISM="Vannella sp., Strain DIVA3 517/6/12" /NCGR_SAMPLE_ID=MMETSP0168 /ASSEMBLY_ACC=CAM_ASM_000044 /LENGTH=428 /DNA_ID=CAMNT_0001828839 /DNA_START=40 /DNA_END=1322 /DNA_ORIENTATION=-
MESRVLECGVLHVGAEPATGQQGVFAYASDAKGEDTAVASLVTVSLEFTGAYAACGGARAEAVAGATTVFVLHRFLLLGVFDGHAGKTVSHWLRENYLERFFLPCLLEAACCCASSVHRAGHAPPPAAEGGCGQLTTAHMTNSTPVGTVCVDIAAVLYASFATARDRVLVDPAVQRSGSTGVVLVRDLREEPANTLYCACYGDSKALLVGRDAAGAVLQRSICVMHTAEDEVAQQYARDHGGSVGIYWNGEKGVCCVNTVDLGKPGIPVPPLCQGQAVYRMSTSPNPHATLRYGSKAMSFNFSRSFGDRNIAHLLQQEPQVVVTHLLHEEGSADSVTEADPATPHLPEVRVMTVHGWQAAGVLVASDGLYERREKLRPDEEQVNQETAEQLFTLAAAYTHPELGVAYDRVVRALVEFARAAGSNDDIT